MRQAAQEERRQITVAARTGRTVDFLGDADVAGVVEHAIEADDRFGARQRRTGAGMAAAAEGDMQARVVALDLELAGVFEQIGRAHVSPPVTNAHLVCRLLLEKKKEKK